VVKLAIEFENPAPTWWKSGGRALWEAIAESADAGSVLVDEAIAESWMAEAAKIPGWNGGPEYAPHPIYVKAVNEDDVD
jgi:hypothetical protein